MVTRKDYSDWLPQQAATTAINTAPPQFIYESNDKRFRAVPRQKDKETLMIDSQLAILIDGSYSMTKNQQAINTAVDELQGTGLHYDLFFCRQECIKLDSAQSLNTMYFFGNSQTADHLIAFQRMAYANRYQAILFLTDAGSYELSPESSTAELESPVPLWLVHLNDTLPYAYDDKILDLIYRSKGGVSRSVKEALVRSRRQDYTLNSAIPREAKVISISDDRIWLEQNKPEGAAIKTNPALEKIVIAHQIKQLINSMDTQQLDNLDAIHTLAKQHGIITHYSSMLVLVNDRQKEALKKAEHESERFTREIEDGKQDTTSPTDLFAVPAVPEPDEWALIVLAGILLLVAVLRRKKNRYPHFNN